MTSPFRRRAAALALSLPLLAGAVACGGDDDDDGAKSSAQPREGKALSKAEFIKEGDAICAELNEASEKVTPGGDDLPSLSKFLGEIVVLIERAQEDFEALSPPKDGDKVRRTLVDALGAGIAASRDAQTAAEKNDEDGVKKALLAIQSAGEDIKSSTSGYGFKVCSKSG